jgi:hypothetical protein
MTHLPQQHLTTEEIELWAIGLLSTARALHLPDCSLCRDEAERERRVVLELARLPYFAPGAKFSDRVMAQVKLPTPSGEFRS